MDQKEKVENLAVAVFVLGFILLVVALFNIFPWPWALLITSLLLMGSAIPQFEL